MFKSETIGALAKSLVTAQKNMSEAVKDAKNPFFKSNYADLNSIREAVIPALNKEGISVLQHTATTENKPVIQTMLLHESGEYMMCETDIVCAKQNDPQAYGSAVSYARRYGLQAMVCCGSTDDDGEKAMSRPTTPTTTAAKTTETKKTTTSGWT